MNEFRHTRISDQLNFAFTDTIKIFRQKPMVNTELSDEPRMYIPTPEIYNVEQINADQAIFIGFPEIYCQPSKNSIYIQMPSDIILNAPVGEYGEEWAKKLVFATSELRDKAKQHESPTNIISEMDELSRHRIQILSIDINQDTEINRNLGTLGPFDEGIQSILFAAGILTAYKLPEYEDPLNFMQDLSEQGIFSKLALIIPSTVTARLGYHGWTLTQPVVESINGKLKLSKRITDHYIREAKDAYAGISTSGSKILDRGGCPVARVLPGNSNSGVDMIATMLTSVIASLNQTDL